MRTITPDPYKVYTFSELSKEAKANAIEKNRDINVDFEDWHDWILEDWQEKLEKLGYTDPKIHYTGFWSQGDGACFTSNYIDIDKWIKSHKKIKEFRRIYRKLTENGLYPIEAKLTHNWRYYFAESTTLEIYSNDDKYDKELEKLDSYLLAEREKLGNEIYDQLRKVYQEMQEDEAVIDTLKANDYEFTEEGEIV